MTNNYLDKAPTTPIIYLRSYHRKGEDWEKTTDRTIDGLARLGGYTEEEINLLKDQMLKMKALPSGRWLWIGGTDWVEKPENFYGGYNCSSTKIVDWESFRLMMLMAMQGTGTGAILENHVIDKLPVITNKIEVSMIGKPGDVEASSRIESTLVVKRSESVYILVGDSKEGWVDAYYNLLCLSSDDSFKGLVKVTVDVSNVRPEGEKLKGFGGVANPCKLPDLFTKVANHLNKALGRKLTSVEASLLIDEAALVVVAGNIRRCLPSEEGGPASAQAVAGGTGMGVS